MKKRLLAILLTLLLTLTLPLPAFAADTPEEQAEILLILAELIDNYAMDAPEEGAMAAALAELLKKDPALFDKIVESMYSNLDKYSHYLSGEEYTRAFPLTEAYVGVGVEVDSRVKEGVVIRSVIEGSPALEAGLLAGDQIVSVDGTDTSRMPYSEVTVLIRGEEGSSVTLGIRRPGQGKDFTVTLVRRPLTAPNVYSEIIDETVGYIRVKQFGSVFDYTAFTKAYREMPYQGVRSVIIDMRGNGGGLVDVCYNMINSVVMEDTGWLFALRAGPSHKDYVFYDADGRANWKPNALIILVDEGSASAAEVFSGSLKDLGYATLLGKQTYGKGRSQIHAPMPDESRAIITTYEIILPQTGEYDGKGLTPDIEIDAAVSRLPDDLLPLSADAAIFPTAKSERVAAFEQRMKLLGFWPEDVKPDETFDEQTAAALAAFQEARSLPKTAYVSTAALEAVQAGLNAKYVTDAQWEAALKLAKEAAAEPLKVVPPPKAKWPPEE